MIPDRSRRAGADRVVHHMPAATAHHRLDYVEFAARDLRAAKTFYATVFGWTFTDYGPDYTSFSDGRISGGFRSDLPVPAIGNPLLIVFSSDLEATEAAVRAAGGRISTPPYEFPGGRRFHFHDPNGLELAVWSDVRADGSRLG